jgi:hypothetical protein
MSIPQWLVQSDLGMNLWCSNLVVYVVQVWSRQLVVGGGGVECSHYIPLSNV